MKARALLLSLLPVCLSFGATAATFEDRIAELSAPRLGPEAVSVTGLSIALGHLKLTLNSGSAARVMAGNDPVGIYFKGSGSLQYEAAEPTELPIVTRNVKSDSHLKQNGATLTGDVDEVLLFAAGYKLPELTGSGGTSLAEAFAAHQARFDRARVQPAAHGMILQELAFPAATFARAQIVSGRDTLMYDYDSADEQEETLNSLRSPSYYVGDRTLSNRLYPVVLSQQPIGHDRKLFVRPPFLLSAIDYSLVGDGDNAHMEISETLIPRSAGQRALRFDLDDEFLVKLGAPMRSLRVRSVTDEQGRTLPFHHDRGDLVVGLIEPGTLQSMRLRFVIEGDFLIRYGGDNAWQLGTTAWFPQSPSLAGQAYTVHSLVKVKKPFVPIAPGMTLARREEGDFNVAENVMDRPVQFAVVEAGKYNITAETRNDLTISIATYSLSNPRAAKQLTDLSFAFIDYYQYFLGPFPWKEFHIIQVNDYGWGQAPPATMFITNEAFNPLITEIDQFFSQGINERFAHEIAHQYWGHVVKMPSFEEQWLTESFAEYSAALVLKKLKGEGIFNHLVSSWRSRGAEASPVAPIPYANRIGGDPITASRYRAYLLYSKGPYVLYALNKEIGDAQFLTFLKSYQRSFQWKFGTTKDIAGMLQVLTQKDFRPFLDQYYWGTAMPK